MRLSPNYFIMRNDPRVPEAQPNQKHQTAKSILQLLLGPARKSTVHDRNQPAFSDILNLLVAHELFDLWSDLDPFQAVYNNREVCEQKNEELFSLRAIVSCRLSACRLRTPGILHCSHFCQVGSQSLIITTHLSDSNVEVWWSRISSISIMFAQMQSGRDHACSNYDHALRGTQLSLTYCLLLTLSISTSIGGHLTSICRT
jgi:hypothetical protein